MKIVQIFKTNVQDHATATQIVRFLQSHFFDSRINFDLDDCDNILRIESRDTTITDTEIQNLITKCGHLCEPLQG